MCQRSADLLAGAMFRRQDEKLCFYGGLVVAVKSAPAWRLTPRAAGRPQGSK